jgi:phosphoribosylformimino-5-aminoimidazole carboxamide ribotide isomerase
MIEVIPAIDIMEGKCVRLTKGEFHTKVVYNEDPLDAARRFEDIGVRRLHVVDLDGAKEGRVINYRTLEKLASKSGLAIDFGGGIATDKDLQIAFECGVRQINVGSIAVKDPPLFHRWIAQYGGEAIILAADVKKELVVVRGWQEESKVNVFDLIREFLEKGGRYVLCTDVDKDGMLQGPSHDLYKKIRDEHPSCKTIASGGVTSLQDLEKLSEIGVPYVVVGKALYEGAITMDELTQFIRSSHAR